MSKVTTDHDEIRRWAEGKGGKPAAVDRTHHDGDVGIIRIMFPDAPNSHHGALVEIGWDEFFQEFEDRNLALLFEPDSMFSKIIGRDTAERRAEGDNDASRRDGGGERGGGSGSSGSGGSRGEESEQELLKEREYRGPDGEVHHHTRKYMEQHGSE